MFKNFIKKTDQTSIYERKDLEADIKTVAWLILSNIWENVKSVDPALLSVGITDFMKRIKICEQKHEIDEVEEFNVNKKEDQKLYSVVNVEDVFLQLMKYLNSTFFATSWWIDETVQLNLFRIYKHFLSLKRKEIIEKKIEWKYFDCFYTDPFIKYKSLQLDALNKIPDADYVKYNKIAKTKGVAKMKDTLKEVFIDFIKKNLQTEVIRDITGNDMIAFASLIEDFIPKINDEYVFEGKTSWTSKDKIDFNDCTTQRFFFITEYGANSKNSNIKISNAIIWTNFENIINRFWLNGALSNSGMSKFANVMNKYNKQNLIKDIYIINNTDFSKIIPVLQQAHQRVVLWENPSLNESEEAGLGDNLFESSELFEEFKNDIILTAIRSRVTDIHIKEAGGKWMINFRLDNKTLQTKKVITKDKLQRFYRILIEKASLDNTWSFPIPQDGKLAGPDMIIVDPVNQATYNVEARINLGQGWDKIYIRLTGNSMTPVGTNKEQKVRTLDELGYLKEDIEEIYRITTVSPNGLILVTGATGQWKSTLLFTLLNDLLKEKPEVHMLTIEDPVEMKINLFNVEQNELKDKEQYPIFIKAFLRQDPDWIMVGETRDDKTLYYLKEAALTWHLCFSTFHANDTLSTLNRLINLLTTDISQRKLALLEILTFIKWVVSQKLVPKLCPHCHLEESEANIARLLKQKWYHEDKIKSYMIENKKNNVTYWKTNPDGCSKCDHSWTKGRQVLVEILSFIDPAVADQIKNDKTPEIKRLFDKGLLYVAKWTVDLNKLIGEV